MSTHKFDNRLKKLEAITDSTDRFIPVFVDEKKKEYRIRELNFRGTHEHFQKLVKERDMFTYIVMHIPRPWF